MKRLVLRWLGLLAFVGVLAVVFVRLGEWQLHRMDWRKDLNAHIVANQTKPVVDYSEVFAAGAITKDVQWQRVSVTGEYDASKQIIVRYRNQDDKPGAELLTPIKTEAGDWLLIDRGFIARQSGELDPTVIPTPPSGKVTVTGYVRVSDEGDETATVPVEDRVRLINPTKIGEYWGLPLLDGYVTVLTSTPAQTGDLVPVAPPTLDEGPHFWYAVQWFCFTAIALGGFIVLVRADLADRRKAKARAARKAAASAASGGQSEPGAQLVDQSEEPYSQADRG